MVLTHFRACAVTFIVDSLQFVCLCFSFVSFLGSNSFGFLARLVLAALDEYVKVIIIFFAHLELKDKQVEALSERGLIRSLVSFQAIGTGAADDAQWSAVAQWGYAQSGLWHLHLDWLPRSNGLLCFGLFVASPRTAIFLCQLISIALLEQMPTHTCTHLHTHIHS